MAQQQFDRFEALAAELRLATYAYCFEWADEVNCDLLPRPQLLTSDFDPAEDPEDLVEDLALEDIDIGASHAQIVIGTPEDNGRDATPVFFYCTLLPTIYDYLKTPAILRASRQTNIEAAEVLNRTAFEAVLSNLRFMIPRIFLPPIIDEDNYTFEYNDILGTYDEAIAVWSAYEGDPGTYSAVSMKFPDRPFRQWETTFWLVTILTLIVDVGYGRKFQVKFGTDCEICDGLPLVATFDDVSELVCAIIPFPR